MCRVRASKLYRRDAPLETEQGRPISSAMTAAEPPTQGPAPERSSKAFERLAEPLRRELRLHCYRMLGSLHEAEDLVQETYLRAWRSFHNFEQRGSFRAWLYQIATNACLDALERRKNVRRWLPDQRFPATTELPDGVPARDVPWLEPYPTSSLEGVIDEAPNPEARYALREAVQLAFVAAIQQLSPRQRAALLLCDVLGWAPAEAATLLGGSTVSVSSALQRAREALGRRYPDGRPPVSARPNAAQEKLLDRYLRAWEELDLDSFVALLKEEATYTMPPLPQWYAGRQAIRGFFEWAWKFYESYRLVPIEANGQPAFAAYSRVREGEPWAAHSIHVLSLDHDLVQTLTLFVKLEAQRLFPRFDLPLILADDGG